MLAGEIRVFGQTFSPATPADAIMAGIGLVPEDRKQEALLLARQLRDNVCLVVPDKVSRFGFFDRGAEKPAGFGTHVAALRVTHARRSSRTVRKLSGGNQQKVVFARWLAREPRILILDEPTRGIDVGAKLEIYRLIEELADSRHRHPGDLLRADRAPGPDRPHPRHARRRIVGELPTRRRDRGSRSSLSRWASPHREGRRMITRADRRSATGSSPWSQIVARVGTQNLSLLIALVDPGRDFRLHCGRTSSSCRATSSTSASPSPSWASSPWRRPLSSSRAGSTSRWARSSGWHHGGGRRHAGHRQCPLGIGAASGCGGCWPASPTA